MDDLVAAAPSGLWENHFYGNSGSLQCQTIGWGEHFKFLNHAQVGGQEAPLTFEFDPPEDGCYAVEEFHHGGPCSQNLASEKVVTINYCRGGTRTFYVSQHMPGNRWHTVALLPFYQGTTGKVVVTHVNGSAGFTTADAFRFTRIADRCSSADTKLVQYQEIAQNPETVTLDDTAASLSGSATDSHQCGATSFLQGVFAVSEGDASATFSFMPQASGCYRVEEFHPESCALETNAQVQVNYCLGGVAERSVPLSQRGGQWNILGHWPFYAGVTGSITTRRLGEQSGALWVADAFRVTKASDSCWSVPEAMQFQVAVSAHLDLNVSNDTWLAPMVDLRLSLEEIVTRFSGLNPDQVRLQGLRLAAVAEFELITSVPVGSDAVEKLRADLATGEQSELRSLLCTVVGAVHPCDVEVWCNECIETSEDDAETDDFPWFVVIAAFSILLITVLFTIFALRRYITRVECSKQSVPEVLQQRATGVQASTQCTKDASPAAAIKDEAAQSDAGSTAPPSDVADDLVSGASSRHMLTGVF